MAKKRTGEPWLPAGEYGRSLPGFSINLIVADVARSLRFYREVLQAEERYSDPDFAALTLGGVDFMLHADHTYEAHPWRGDLLAGKTRGLGAEVRLFGVDPDALAERARRAGVPVLLPPTERSHGWRETWVQDPDGYVWAVGVPIGG